MLTTQATGPADAAVDVLPDTTMQSEPTTAIATGAYLQLQKHRDPTGALVLAHDRLLFIDNLRSMLTILVVLHHLAITYGAVGSWYYTERPADSASVIGLSIVVALNQGYFMGLFFFIAGYFVPGAYDRKGEASFIKDRCVRLGVPLLIFTLVVSPVLEYVKVLQGGEPPAFWSFTIDRWRELNFAPGPLWFLEVLLVLSVVYSLGRRLADRLGMGPIHQETAWIQEPLTNIRVLIFVLGLAAVSFVVRIVCPLGGEWNHLELAFFPQYIGLFLAGVAAYRQDWLPDVPRAVARRWTMVAVIAILAFPVVLLAGNAFTDATPFSGGLHWQSLLASTWEACYAAGMCITLLSVFRRRFDSQGKLARVLSMNAYTVYLIHAPVIVALAYTLSGVTVSALLKFALVAPLAVGLCFVLSHFGVRRLPRATSIV